MRRNLLILTIFMTIVLFSACTSEKPMEPDTPEKAAIMLKQAISNNDEEGLNALLIESKRDTLSKDTLKEMKSIATAGAELQKYEIIQFENGEMLLIRLSEDLGSGRYEIADIKQVPEEMKELFE